VYGLGAIFFIGYPFRSAGNLILARVGAVWIARIMSRGD
jgi:hypothetical protein